MPLPPRITIRCATEDLGLDTWSEVGPIAGLVNEVDHPIIRNAISKFPNDRDETEAPETISTVSPTCFKLKTGRWRGAAYRDSEEQVWIVAAGQRHGKAQKDFYQAFMAMNRAYGPDIWRPTGEDQRLLRRDQAELELRSWEQEIWDRFSAMLRKSNLTDTVEIEVADPFLKNSGADVSTISVELILFDDESEPLGIEVRAQTQDWSKREPFERVALYAIMCRIHQGEQHWSISPGNNGNIVATLELSEEVSLAGVVEGHYQSSPPVNFSPGANSHVVHHSQGLTACTISSTPVSAVCGQVFVPRQDFVKLPKCPDCESIEKVLKRAAENHGSIPGS